VDNVVYVTADGAVHKYIAPDPIPPPTPPSASLVASPNNGYNCLGTADTISWTVSNCGTACEVSLTGRGVGYAADFNVTLPHLPLSSSYSTTPRDQIEFTLNVSSSSGSASARKTLTIASPNVCGGGTQPTISMYWFAVKASSRLVPQCTWIALPSDSQSNAEAQLNNSYGSGYTIIPISEDDFDHQRKCP
jgi:hypothetical protein